MSNKSYFENMISIEIVKLCHLRVVWELEMEKWVNRKVQNSRRPKLVCLSTKESYYFMTIPWSSLFHFGGQITYLKPTAELPVHPLFILVDRSQFSNHCLTEAINKINNNYNVLLLQENIVRFCISSKFLSRKSLSFPSPSRAVC